MYRAERDGLSYIYSEFQRKKGDRQYSSIQWLRNFQNLQKTIIHWFKISQSIPRDNVIKLKNTKNNTVK